MPIEQVSRLLGHSSIRVTEKHYSPWVQALQEQLELGVGRTWDADLIASRDHAGRGEGSDQLKFRGTLVLRSGHSCPLLSPLLRREWTKFLTTTNLRLITPVTPVLPLL